MFFSVPARAMSIALCALSFEWDILLQKIGPQQTANMLEQVAGVEAGKSKMPLFQRDHFVPVIGGIIDER